MPAPSPDAALYELLCDLFHSRPRELVRFVEHGYGRRLARDLPERAPLSELAFEVVGLLRRHGHIKEELFVRLADALPGRHPEIGEVAARWGHALPSPRLTPAESAATSPPPLPDAIASASPTWDAFVSYAAVDTAAVRRLVENLHRLGLDIFFDAWEIDPGTVVSARLDEGLRGSRCGVLVISRAALTRPWVLQEYTVLLQKAVEHGQRLIPVRLDDAPLPPMLATRRFVDLRGKTGEDYVAAIKELAAAIRGELPPPPPRGGSLDEP